MMEMDTNGEFSIAPAAVLASRLVTRSQKSVPQPLIKWLTSDQTSAT